MTPTPPFPEAHPPLRLATARIALQTRGHTAIHDLTPALAERLRESGLAEGQATVFVVGSTAAVTTVEYEPGLVKDLRELFERLAPSGRDYHHHATWHDDNGHSHVRASLIGPSVSSVFPSFRLCSVSVFSRPLRHKSAVINFSTSPDSRPILRNPVAAHGPQELRMKLGITRSTRPDERRVPLIPETVKKLLAKKIDVVIQAGAGEPAFFADAEYVAAGAAVLSSAEAVLTTADTIVQIQRPEPDAVGALREGSALICLLYPLSNLPVVKALAARRITTIALDMIPRTTLAQSMDVLSSQANIAGYWAVVAAASRLPKFFPMLMTAAGTITPARVLIMGAGVAGLQAIGTAKRLGAIVEATDVRPETKEQVESLGGKFLVVQGVEVKSGQGGYAAEQSEEYKKKQAEMVAEHIAKADVVITTALIPGRKAPILVTDAHVKSMRAGSVIVDLAAEQGGNVEGCEPGKEAVRHGVTIIGPSNTPSALAVHASQALSRNLEKLLLYITADGAWKLNMDDEIVKGCVITREGEIAHPKVKEAAK